jgi:hypothetical protein
MYFSFIDSLSHTSDPMDLDHDIWPLEIPDAMASGESSDQDLEANYSRVQDGGRGLFVDQRSRRGLDGECHVCLPDGRRPYIRRNQRNGCVLNDLVLFSASFAWSLDVSSKHRSVC